MKKDLEVEAIEEQVKTCAIDSATALLEGRLDDARWSATRMQEHRRTLTKHRVAQTLGGNP